MEMYNLKIVFILTIGFTLASILGYLSQRAKLSPLLGYLIAGYLIGPYSPGFVADMVVSEQLAEIGVILMMFGVGMHFKWQDLVHVKNIAIPGAIGQTIATTVLGTALIYYFGWSIQSGIIIGLSIGVASTVILVRVLSDNQIIQTREGHIAVGWLIVEDIITVIVLLLMPIVATPFGKENTSFFDIISTVLLFSVKFLLLIFLIFTIGHKCVKYILFNVARTRSQELFTLTILALIFAIAAGSAFAFGTSIALGAFIAGMMIGQTDVRYQAFANALPLKDVFVVIFFLSVGMIFNPHIILEEFPLFISILGIILLIKPLIAFLIVKLLRYPFRTALTVSIALAQIGEFSFILSEEAMRLNLLPDEGYDIIVACAIVSISLNPILFKRIDWICSFIKKKFPHLKIHPNEKRGLKNTPKAIVVGFGPIGQNVTSSLEKIGYDPTIIDENVDTVAQLGKSDHRAVYGDAATPNILEAAHVENASLLAITIPDIATTINIINLAQQLNPKIQILARVDYFNDELQLKDLNVTIVCCEEEAIKAFNHEIFKIKMNP